MTDRRKTITFRCFGCSAQATLRVPRHGRPPAKPPLWQLYRFWWRDPENGVLREAQLPFCRRTCAELPDPNTGMARRVRAYVEDGPRAPTVQYVCAACGARDTMRREEPPQGWVYVPVPAPDFDTGAARVTTLPFCGQECANIGTQYPPPPAVARERDRLFAGRGA